MITVDLSRSGIDPDLEEAIEVKVKVLTEEISCYKRNMGNGIYVFTFKPEIPLTHRVHVMCHGYGAKGCPFDLLVTDNGAQAKDTVVTGSGLYMARCARSAGFTILTKG
jgi:hypothetical protein